MTVQEMHIGIDLLLQKVNSNFISSISPQEKDWFLNDEMLRFIKQRTNPLSNDKRQGDQDTQKRYDDLKSLIKTTNPPLPVYIRDSKSVFAYLPSDYVALKSDLSFTKNLCGAAYSVTTVSSNIYYVAIDLPTVFTDYSSLVIQINAVTVFNSANYPQFVTSANTIKARFEYIDFIIEAMRAAGYESKYESYLNLFFKGRIIISSAAPISVSVIVPSGTVIYSGVTLTNTKINTISGTDAHPNRLTKTEDVNDIVALSLGGTIYYSPISTLQRDVLNVYHNQKFIMSAVALDYIRKPRKISLPLNQGCELDETVHAEIVDNAAKRIAGVLTSGNYQYLANENLMKE